MIAQPAVGAALLRADEVLELHRIAHEEDRRVVADHVVVAFGRVELDREAARVAPRVGAAALAGHRREPVQRVGLRPQLEDPSLRVLGHVVRHLEMTKASAAFGVRLTLGDALPVEVRHLLDEVVIVQDDGAIRADGERVFVAGDGSSGVGGGGFALVLIAHLVTPRRQVRVGRSGCRPESHRVILPQRPEDSPATVDRITAYSARRGRPCGPDGLRRP